jgi:DNA-binding CsgD family transcriptional regulator
MAFETRREVRAFSPGGAQTSESIAASRPLDRHLLDNGIRMRTLYLDSARNDPPTADHLDWLAERGAQIRTVPVLPVRMLIVDQTYAVVPIDAGDSAAGACVVRGSGEIAALTSLFEHVWRTANRWERTAAPNQRCGARQTPSASERAVLELLVQGHTDDQVGRKLGVSTRTVGRMTADLMGRLGARSRFEAGARAVARGWLTVDVDAGPQ